jgi:hypothetical protein
LTIFERIEAERIEAERYVEDYKETVDLKDFCLRMLACVRACVCERERERKERRRNR